VPLKQLVSNKPKVPQRSTLHFTHVFPHNGSFLSCLIQSYVVSRNKTVKDTCFKWSLPGQVPRLSRLETLKVASTTNKMSRANSTTSRMTTWNFQAGLEYTREEPSASANTHAEEFIREQIQDPQNGHYNPNMRPSRKLSDVEMRNLSPPSHFKEPAHPTPAHTASAPPTTGELHPPFKFGDQSPEDFFKSFFKRKPTTDNTATKPRRGCCGGNVCSQVGPRDWLVVFIIIAVVITGSVLAAKYGKFNHNHEEHVIEDRPHTNVTSSSMSGFSTTMPVPISTTVTQDSTTSTSVPAAAHHSTSKSLPATASARTTVLSRPTAVTAPTAVPGLNLKLSAQCYDTLMAQCAMTPTGPGILSTKEFEQQCSSVYKLWYCNMIGDTPGLNICPAMKSFCAAPSSVGAQTGKSSHMTTVTERGRVTETSAGTERPATEVVAGLHSFLTIVKGPRPTGGLKAMGE
jgi:hypothetical protein